MLTGEATGPLDGQSQLESSREEITASRCGPRSSRWWRCRPPTASEGLGIQSVAKDLGMSCRLNLHLDVTRQRCAWSIAGDWARRSMLTCETSGYRRLPSQAVHHEDG